MHIAFFELESWEMPFLQGKLASISSAHELVMEEDQLTLERLEGIRGADILSTFIYSHITDEVLERLPNLKLIATRSTGYDHIDVEAAKKRGIAVANVPSYGENTVAEHTFALILALSRKMYPAIIRTRDFDFSTGGLRGWDLKGKTLGIIGMGHIGTHVARVARGFEMIVLGFDPKVSTEEARTQGVALVPFERLIRESDVITLHCPYNQHTHHLLNREAFTQMKDGVYIINTARGGLIDTKALLEALETKKVAGAGLDVLEEECEVKEERQLASKHWKDPLCDLQVLLANHVLTERENVIITPHNAWNSHEAIERILDTTVENIVAFLAGKPRNIVT